MSGIPALDRANRLRAQAIAENNDPILHAMADREIYSAMWAEEDSAALARIAERRAQLLEDKMEAGFVSKYFVTTTAEALRNIQRYRAERQKDNK